MKHLTSALELAIMIKSLKLQFNGTYHTSQQEETLNQSPFHLMLLTKTIPLNLMFIHSLVQMKLKLQANGSQIFTSKDQ
jgi:hypothetical protein